MAHLKSGPRTIGGHPMKLLGRAYYVLLDAADGEVSERAHGMAWFGVEAPGHAHLVFDPDTMGPDGHSIFLEATGHAVAYGMVLDFQLVIRNPAEAVYPRDTVRLDLAKAYEFVL